MTRALVAGGVLIQVQLVVVLGVPPGPGGQDLGLDAAPVPLGVGLGRDLARHPLLLRAVEVHRAPVLRPDVGPLPVRRRRVVHPVEELEQLPVCRLRGVEEDLQRFCVCVCNLGLVFGSLLFPL